MRSIRLSLMVYFLLLVSASLGVALLLVYNISQRTLLDKEEAAAKLIQARYEERRREAENRLDDRLLNHAKTLAGRVRPNSRAGWERIHKGHYQLQFLGLLTSCAAPGGHVLAPLWCLEGAPPRPTSPGRWPIYSAAQWHIWRHDLIRLSLGKDVDLPEDGDSPRIVSLLQTNGWGPPLNLGSLDMVSLPDESRFARSERITWKFDDFTLANGVTLRRVRFRSLLTLQEPPGPPLPRSYHSTAPQALIIQCAASIRDLDASLADARTLRDEEREQLRTETTAALSFQRYWLLVIISCTFAATILGCIGLVWLGLVPVRKLSDAVSQINSRNFTLALGDRPLPVELQPIAERLTETLDQLRRAFTREKQATADISHELRTPLAALLTTIELALRKPRTAEQYREMLQESLQSAQQMHQIVERLLTLARLDAGVDRLRARDVDVLDLAAQCAMAVRPLAEARGLRVEVRNECPGADLDDHLASLVNTDPDKLREVLSNLLHNAIQYNRPEGQIDLVVARNNGYVRVEVRDTGIGMSPESRERIFERFYRVDPSRSNDGTNAGLGLAIVKEYIELMGGEIRVESTLGKGSTFRVELPMQAPSSAA